MIAASGVLFLAIAASPVQVVQVIDDGCPTGAEVEQALASMLTASSNAAPQGRDLAKLTRTRDTLRVELIDPDGVVIAERMVEGGGSCAELARIAAIVIASWESDVHPEFVRKPAEIIQIERAPAMAPAPPPAAAPRSAAAYDLAGGVTLGQADALAAGASLGAAWFPRGVGLGLWILGTGELARTIAVGEHEARWRRWTANLELARRWAHGRFAIDPHAGLTLGWLQTEGVDYTQNRSDAAVSLGGTAGIRVEQWVSTHAALWLDVRGFYFPRQDSTYGFGADAPTTADEAALPRWGGIASVGVALGRASLSQ